MKMGVTPSMGFPKASARETVMNETETPSALTGDVPMMSELAALGAPAVKVTVPSAFETGVAIDSVLISAFVDAKVQLDSPEALVAEQVP